MPFSALENVRFLRVSTSTSTCAKSGEDHFLTSRSAISSAFLRLSLLSSSLVVDIDLLPREKDDDKADTWVKKAGKNHHHLCLLCRHHRRRQQQRSVQN